MRQSKPTYLTLSPDCSLRLLERPHIFDKARDELYEVDAEAFEFVRSLPLSNIESNGADAEFLEFCLDEGILVHATEASPAKAPMQSPIPSLRYLLLHITTRCNLKCAHCFHGDVEPLDMPMHKIERVMKEFEDMQGLRLLVSGGEPFLHPRFDELNDLFDKFSFRSVILSNGTLIDASITKGLRAHEVQVSLDGVGASHDRLRGAGSYEKALKGLETLATAGIDVSIATMAHAENLSDFDELESLVQSLGAKEWSIDVPARAGRCDSSADAVVLDEIAPILDRSFGGGAHFSGEDGYGCGAHLCAVMADGAVCKCGFYADSPIGTIDEGLARGWRAIPRIKIDQLGCDCDIVLECRGGCRYRAEMAGDVSGKDPVMCAANGLPR